jgi:hypothetical protein
LVQYFACLIDAAHPRQHVGKSVPTGSQPRGVLLVVWKRLVQGTQEANGPLIGRFGVAVVPEQMMNRSHTPVGFAGLPARLRIVSDAGGERNPQR